MQQSLNGQWEIAESMAAEEPGLYERTVPVPGLARLASPRFSGLSVAEIGWLPLEVRQKARSDPRRNYFWYRRTFAVPTEFTVARLRFAKAQFGIKVWLNGAEVGESFACFSSATFDVSRFLARDRNELVVRVGAHPLMVPPGVPTGSDHEKYLWTAGIYDNVELQLTGACTIDGIQIAPDVSASAVTAQWTVCNRGKHPVRVTPRLRLAPRKDGREVAHRELEPCTLAPDEERPFIVKVEIPEASLWSPEDPFLYDLTLAIEGDERTVPFGMREFRFDTATRRAWLNGRIYFLRGTNITLHRFFEDEACGQLPWDDAWVRRLLGELPKKYHWNTMRWSIGPVPEHWLRMADEVGLLVQYEFPIWTWRPEWSHARTLDYVQRWMADSWNHPSVVWWSLSNETRHPPLISLLAQARHLDLAKRPWSNGYNLPEGEDDPIDDHPYKWHAPVAWPAELWSDDKYPARTAENTSNAPHPSAHASVANEYCWFWLRRNGEPTELTAGVYARYLSRGRTADERRRLYAYYLAAETEYFRAHRNFAGVMHFVYLTCDHPWALTGDLFRDVSRLEVHEVFDTALRSAFNPLGVYLDHWKRSCKGGEPLELHAMVVNDDYERREGELTFSITDARDRRLIETARMPFAVAALGQHTFRCDALKVPTPPGLYFLSVVACASDGVEVTSSREIEVLASAE